MPRLAEVAGIDSYPLRSVVLEPGGACGSANASVLSRPMASTTTPHASSAVTALRGDQRGRVRSRLIPAPQTNGSSSDTDAATQPGLKGRNSCVAGQLHFALHGSR